MSAGTEIDTEFTSEPTCPHCGLQDQDWAEFRGLRGDGDTIVVECDCEKSYSITMHVSHDFTTEPRAVTLAEDIAHAEKRLARDERRVVELTEDDPEDALIGVYNAVIASQEHDLEKLKKERKELQEKGEWL